MRFYLLTCLYIYSEQKENPVTMQLKSNISGVESRYLLLQLVESVKMKELVFLHCDELHIHCYFRRQSSTLGVHQNLSFPVDDPFAFTTRDKPLKPRLLINYTQHRLLQKDYKNTHYATN